MKERLVIYGILLCLCLSAWGLLDVLKANEKFEHKMDHVAVGIELK